MDIFLFLLVVAVVIVMLIWFARWIWRSPMVDDNESDDLSGIMTASMVGSGLGSIATTSLTTDPVTTLEKSPEADKHDLDKKPMLEPEPMPAKQHGASRWIKSGKPGYHPEG